MAATTVADIITDVGYAMKDTAGTNYVEAEVIAYINDAIRRVVERVARDWPAYWLNSGEAYTATDSIVANQPNYDLPATFYLMLQVVATDSEGDDTTLEPIDLPRSFDSDEDNGYLLINKDIYLYPTPDANVADGLVLWYIGAPAAMTATTDTTPLGEHFRDAIKEYVVLKCKARQGEPMGDMAVFYDLVQKGVAPVIERTNRSKDRAGMSMAVRNWI